MPEPAYPQSTHHSPLYSALHGTALHSSRQPPAPATKEDSSGQEFSLFGNLVDALNPLHHIPVFSTLYRHVTGREIGILPRIASGALWGGPIGVGASVIGHFIENAIKNNPGQHTPEPPHKTHAKQGAALQTSWYLAGSPAAPNIGSTIRNDVPEDQGRQKRMIAQKTDDGSRHATFPGRTHFPARNALSYPQQKLNPETVSTLQMMAQTDPHGSAPLHRTKKPNSLTKAGNPVPATNGAGPRQKSMFSLMPNPAAGSNTQAIHGGLYRHT